MLPLHMIGILGAGAMGSALAAHLAREGRDVTLCATIYDAQAAHAIEHGLPHPGLGIALGKGIRVAGPDEWPDALAAMRIVTVAVSTSGLAGVIEDAARSSQPEALWAIATKGWEETTLRSSATVASDTLGDPSRVVQIVGPSLAVEVAAGVPTGVVAACVHLPSAIAVAEAFASPRLHVRATTDVIGVEIGSALKNVIAIAVGLCDGVAEHEGRAWTNTKAMLFSRGLAEMRQLVRASGGDVDTVIGLAGSGDLFVTCLGGRNARFGRLVGLGTPPKVALEEMNTTVEGYANAPAAAALAAKFGLDLSIVRAVNAVLFEGMGAEEAIRSLSGGVGIDR